MNSPSWVADVRRGCGGRRRPPPLYSRAARPDEELRALAARGDPGPLVVRAKPESPFGRRVAWYALTRLIRPAKTRRSSSGVHDGLGGAAVPAQGARALASGDGRLVSFDINPAAVWLVGSHRLWELRIEPRRRRLLLDVLAAGQPVDVFIRDGLRSTTTSAPSWSSVPRGSPRRRADHGQRARHAGARGRVRRSRIAVHGVLRAVAWALLPGRRDGSRHRRACEICR